eukprot:gene19187-25801_t
MSGPHQGALKTVSGSNDITSSIPVKVSSSRARGASPGSPEDWIIAPLRSWGLTPRVTAAATTTPVLPAAPLRSWGLTPRVTATATTNPVLPQKKKIDANSKEASRKYRRNVYTSDDWIKHRSSDRYRRHMSTMFTSGNVASLMGLAAFLELVEVAQVLHLIPEWPSFFKPMSELPFTIAGASLSLLLVFRTNASYRRWDEAGKMWGLMVNRSRDSVRQAMQWFPEEEDGLKDMYVRYIGALPKSMMVHLRCDEDLKEVHLRSDEDLKEVHLRSDEDLKEVHLRSDDLEEVHLRSDEDLKEVMGNILLPEEFAALEASPHPPVHVMQVLGAITQRANLHPMEKASMDRNITAFEDVLGSCGSDTPVPISYTRLTLRFLIVYLFALPWVLVPLLDTTAIPACALTTFFMLGIEEIGVQIEEPFSILALEDIAETIASNARLSREETRTLIPALVAKSITAKTPKAESGGDTHTDAGPRRP